MLSALYFIYDDLVQSIPMSRTRYKLYHHAPLLVVNTWMFWGPLALFNFGVVPLQFRMLVINVASVFWGVYFSYYTRKASLSHTSAKKDDLEDGSRFESPDNREAPRSE
uniref:Uncharacterized protein n=1 Tax=Compsopogon caeruleus TaxID=31354 RepID=A0A7S1XEU3_9RHOD|mmetsp:Transcript_4470/g.8887  ORF Transcript_4470/g.8887 Transcript_4470/m.8887 type:complete len:109 (+) Transcript_4470:140-466(+)